ncbi:MAG: CU044_5270 family protein [Thermoleophilia bacterium]
MPDTVTRGVEAAYPPVTDHAAARDAALRALAREIDGAAPRRSRRRLALVAATGAVAVTLAGAGVARMVLPGEAGLTPRADAATVKALETGARAAAAAPAVAALGPGQYLYTHSQSTTMVTSVSEDGDTSYLVREDRRSWIGDGRLHLVGRSEPVRFLAGDRAAWEAAVREARSRPAVSDERYPSPSTIADAFAQAGASDEALSKAADDPEAAARLLRGAAGRYGGQPADQEAFTMVGDGLRESVLSPGARAALFRAAAYIEGVRSIGAVRDSHGRAGIGVAREADGILEVLIFDPSTSQLLEEQQRTIAPVEWLPGVPAGTVIGRSTYLVSAVVGSDTATP